MKCERENSGGLTPRQISVLKGVADGLSSKEIAYNLGLSLKTVEFHRANIERILNVKGIARLTRIALAFGLTQLCLMLLVGCVSAPAPTPTPPPPPPKTALFDAGTSAHALVRPIKSTLTSATLAWNPYTNTLANALLLSWNGGNTILPRNATSFQITGLRAGSLYTFSLCGTNTVYVQPLLSGQCCSTNWTATLWTSSTAASTTGF